MGKADATRERILACAKDEFLTKGFTEASLRDISAAAGVTTGAVYRYYESKDVLFEALVRPAMDAMDTYFNRETEKYMEKASRGEITGTGDLFGDSLHAWVELFYHYPDAFQLLTLCAAGSFCASYIDDLIARDAGETVSFVGMLHDDTDYDLGIHADDLIALTRMNYYAVFDVVQRKLTKEEALRYVSLLKVFLEAGWSKLFHLS